MFYFTSKATPTLVALENSKVAAVPTVQWHGPYHNREAMGKDLTKAVQAAGGNGMLFEVIEMVFP